MGKPGKLRRRLNPRAAAFGRIAKKHHGLKARVARALDITPQAVNDWRGVVPLEHLDSVEKISGYPREDLRPDIFKRK